MHLLKSIERQLRVRISIAQGKGCHQPGVDKPEVWPRTHRLPQNFGRLLVITDREIRASLDIPEHMDQLVLGAEFDGLSDQRKRALRIAKKQQLVRGLGIGRREVWIDLDGFPEGVERGLMVAMYPIDPPQSSMRTRNTGVEADRFSGGRLRTVYLSLACVIPAIEDVSKPANRRADPANAHCPGLP